MSSHLSCLGMAVSSAEELDALIGRITAQARQPVGSKGVQTFVWQDSSGARMVYDDLPGRPLILPSYAARSSVAYTEVVSSTPDVARVTILGEDGRTPAGITCELEQRRHLDEYPTRGRISLVALGVDVKLYADEQEFTASDDSLMGTEDELGPAPSDALDEGLSWPPRMSTRAFFADGFYEEDGRPTPHALMSAVVLSAEEKEHGLTGQPFHVLRVLTSFGELDLCLSAVEHDLPRPGQIVAGTVAVVGSLAARPFSLISRAAPAPAAPEAEAHSGSTRVTTEADEDAPAEAAVSARAASGDRLPLEDAPLPGETRREYRERVGRG